MKKINYKAILTVHGLTRQTKVKELVAWLRKTADRLEKKSEDYSKTITRFRLMK